MGYECSIGDKICNTAKIMSTLSKIVMVISIIVGVIALINNEEEMAVILIPCGLVCFLGVVFTWPALYALGQIANDIREIKNQNEK